MTAEWPRAILHCDMDAFFASVEQLDFPELRGKPTVIGGDPGSRSVVCAASYEARIYGVKSAMPSRMVSQLCPNAEFRRPRFHRYVEISEQMNAVFRRYSPMVEPISIDESYIDVTGSQRLKGSPGDMAERVKEEVLKETGLTVSIGVATSKFVAKMGSRADKPNGLVVVPPGSEKDFLWPTPIDKMWGVGEPTCALLKSGGIETMGDLANCSAEWIFRKMGKVGLQLKMMANGVDFRGIEHGITPKSVTNSTTLIKNTTSLDTLSSFIIYLSHLVGYRLREQYLAGSTVILKGKWDDMRPICRQAPLPFPTDIDKDISTAAIELLKSEPLTRPIRNIGVGVTKIVGARGPFLLREAQKERCVDRAFDKVEDKYGDGVITRLAVLLHVERPRADHPFTFYDRLKSNVESGN